MKYLIFSLFALLLFAYFQFLNEDFIRKTFVYADVSSIKLNKNGSFERNGGSSVIGFIQSKGTYDIKEKQIILKDSACKYTMSPLLSTKIDTTNGTPIIKFDPPPELKLSTDTLYIWNVSSKDHRDRVVLNFIPQTKDSQLDHDFYFYWRDYEIVQREWGNLGKKRFWGK